MSGGSGWGSAGTGGAGPGPAVPLAPLQAKDPHEVGGYRLVGRLGAGGMGVAYLAEADDGRWVVVKTLRAELADDRSFRARLAREVEAMRRVEPGYAAAVLSSDLDGDAPFLAMEYVPGVTLAQRVADGGPLPPESVYRLAAELAAVLDAVHRAGVVHRDLKPANVMLSPHGVRLIDFGVADLSDATALTRTGLVVGSAGWLAPEQITGDQVGPATDVHAWACVITYAAAGVAPFAGGQTAATIYKVLHEDPAVPALPDPLHALVVAALAKDPHARPSVPDIRAQLAEAAPWLATPDGAPHPPAVPTPASWSQPGVPAPGTPTPPPGYPGTPTPPPGYPTGAAAAAAAAAGGAYAPTPPPGYPGAPTPPPGYGPPPPGYPPGYGTAAPGYGTPPTNPGYAGPPTGAGGYGGPATTPGSAGPPTSPGYGAPPGTPPGAWTPGGYGGPTGPAGPAGPAGPTTTTSPTGKPARGRGRLIALIVAAVVVVAAVGAGLVLVLRGKDSGGTGTTTQGTQGTQAARDAFPALREAQAGTWSDAVASTGPYDAIAVQLVALTDIATWGAHGGTWSTVMRRDISDVSPGSMATSATFSYPDLSGDGADDVLAQIQMTDSAGAVTEWGLVALNSGSVADFWDYSSQAATAAWLLPGLHLADASAATPVLVGGNGVRYRFDSGTQSFISEGATPSGSASASPSTSEPSPSPTPVDPWTAAMDSLPALQSKVGAGLAWSDPVRPASGPYDAVVVHMTKKGYQVYAAIDGNWTPETGVGTKSWKSATSQILDVTGDGNKDILVRVIDKDGDPYGFVVLNNGDVPSLVWTDGQEYGFIYNLQWRDGRLIDTYSNGDIYSQWTYDRKDKVFRGHCIASGCS